MARQLHLAGFELHLISSVALARTREVMFGTWVKMTPRMPGYPAYAEPCQSQRFYDPLVEQINDIQELSKTHEIVSKAKAELWHRIQTHYMPLYFLEAERYKRRSRSGWLLNFLKEFPTPESITRYSKEMDLSRFSSAPSSHLSGYLFESQGALPT